MAERATPRWPLVLTSLAIALVLSVVALPETAARLRPAMVPMVAFYWTLAHPDRFGIVIGFCLGLLLDALTGTLLGSHALALTVTCFVVAKAARVLRFFPLWQQSLALLPVWGLYAFMLFWIDGVTGRNADAMMRFMPVVTTALAWPLMAMLLGWRYPTEED